MVLIFVNLLKCEPIFVILMKILQKYSKLKFIYIIIIKLIISLICRFCCLKGFMFDYDLFNSAHPSSHNYRFKSKEIRNFQNIYDCFINFSERQISISVRVKISKQKFPLFLSLNRPLPR